MDPEKRISLKEVLISPGIIEKVVYFTSLLNDYDLRMMEPQFMRLFEIDWIKTSYIDPHQEMRAKFNSNKIVEIDRWLDNFFYAIDDSKLSQYKEAILED